MVGTCHLDTSRQMGRASNPIRRHQRRACTTHARSDTRPSTLRPGLIGSQVTRVEQSAKTPDKSWPRASGSGILRFWCYLARAHSASSQPESRSTDRFRPRVHTVRRRMRRIRGLQRARTPKGSCRSSASREAVVVSVLIFLLPNQALCGSSRHSRIQPMTTVPSTSAPRGRPQLT